MVELVSLSRVLLHSVLEVVLGLCSLVPPSDAGNSAHCSVLPLSCALL